jgi:1,4-alpha-glucan branching enzyme
MIKAKGAKGTASITFSVEPDVGGARAAVCGDWNEWDAERDPMEPVAGGGFTLTLTLPRGKVYRFRYLVDGERWENDWAPDGYAPNSYGGDDCLLDLTAASSTRAGARKAPRPKKEAAAAASTS